MVHGIESLTEVRKNDISSIAVVVFPAIPDILIGDIIALRDSRSGILLDSPAIHHLLQRDMFVVDRLALGMIPWRSRAEYIL